MSIIIFTRPVHSGKTTQLLQWCNEQKNIHGILMPDINGSRKLLNISTKEIFKIECTNPENTNELLTTVGKYHFYTASFDKANLILLNALVNDPDWLIIDEAGKLELDGMGFYNAITAAVPIYESLSRGTLLITVRDSLCEKVIDFFKLKSYRVIHQLEELA